jgi:hypothetical protein
MCQVLTVKELSKEGHHPKDWATYCAGLVWLCREIWGPLFHGLGAFVGNARKPLKQNSLAGPFPPSNSSLCTRSPGV